MVPFTDNPNAPNIIGKTPIYVAAQNGHAKIVKMLAPLTENPNAPDIYGVTPISIAKNAEIRNILDSFNTSRKRKSEQSMKTSVKQFKKS